MIGLFASGLSTKTLYAPLTAKPSLNFFKRTGLLFRVFKLWRC